MPAAPTRAVSAMLLLLLAAIAGQIAAAPIGAEPPEAASAGMEARLEAAITAKLEARMGGEHQAQIAALQAQLAGQAQEMRRENAAMRARIDAVLRHGGALQNRTRAAETELRQQNAALSVEVVEVRGALRRLSNKTSTYVRQISARLDACDAQAASASERRNLQSQGPKTQGDVARIWKVRIDDEGAGTPGSSGKEGGPKGGGKRRGRRMQQDAGQCDGQALDRRTQEFTAACTRPSDDGGWPTSCDAACAAVAVPLWRECRVQLGPTVAAQMKHLVKSCPSEGDAPSPPPPAPGGGVHAVQQLVSVCPIGAEASNCIPECNAERQGDDLLLNYHGNDVKWTCEEGNGARRPST
jgi:hypothetical protein